MNKRYPRYPDDADYQTNAPSYYEDLARKQKLIQLLAEKIWEYEETLNLTLEQISDHLESYIEENDSLMNERLKQWDSNLEKFPENVELLLQEWLSDGTLDHIINDTIFNWKADKTYVDSEIKRLDQEDEKLATQLAQTVPVYNNLKFRSNLKYGEIELPDDFNYSGDYKIWRDIDGKIKHNWEFDDSDYVIRYVKASGSNNLGDGLSPETAYRDLMYAINEFENNSSLTNVLIKIVGNTARGNVTLGSTPVKVSKNYIIEAEKPVATNERVSFTVHSGNVYVGNIAYDISGVFRDDGNGKYGLPSELNEVSSLNECLNTKNTYFHDGAKLYVHKKGTTIDNTYVLLQDNLLHFELTGNNTVMLRDLIVLNGGVNQPVYSESTGSIKGNFICENVKLISTGHGSSANGISTQNIKDVKVLECVSLNATRDNFNYHSSLGEGTTVFEYNCQGHEAGINNTSQNNNVSTAHDGIHILRVGTKGSNSRGPLIADVNGCYSINYDVFVHNSIFGDTFHSIKTGFRFQDDATPAIPNPKGKAILVNCGAGGVNEFGITADDSYTSENKIFIDNFVGKNILNSLLISEY